MTTSPDDDGTPDDPQSIDAAFDEIVANIDQPGTGQQGTAASTAPWPSVEDRDPEQPPEPPAEPTPQLTPRKDWPEWADVRMPPEPVEELAEPDEGHYVPPPPPPVPRGDKVARWAWAGAIGAPTLAIVLPLIGWGLDGFTGIFLVGAFLAGFVTLISRMRTGPRVDDGPDDGAVV